MKMFFLNILSLLLTTFLIKHIPMHNTLITLTDLDGYILFNIYMNILTFLFIISF